MNTSTPQTTTQQPPKPKVQIPRRCQRRERLSAPDLTPFFASPTPKKKKKGNRLKRLSSLSHKKKEGGSTVVVFHYVPLCNLYHSNPVVDPHSPHRAPSLLYQITLDLRFNAKLSNNRARASTARCESTKSAPSL